MSSRPRLCGTANAGSGGDNPVATKPIGSAALGPARTDRFVETGADQSIRMPDPTADDPLVAQGHEVTLFASGDSETAAKLVPCVPQGLRLAGIRDHIASHLVMLNTVRRRADEFDVIHFHVDLLQYPLFQDLAHKCVTTLHGRLDLPDFQPVYHAFPTHAAGLDLRRPATPHAAARELARDRPPRPALLACARSIRTGGDYLAFLGRISPEKRPDRAIEIAKRAGVPLKIAAKVDKVDQDYFEEVIRPLLDHPLVEFIGEINEHREGGFLGNALALLFPIDWPEPFGLVMIEAMSAGTPVIAWRHGSVSEVIEDGMSGVVVDSIDEAVSAVDRGSGYEPRPGAAVVSKHGSRPRGWPATTWRLMKLCCPAPLAGRWRAVSPHRLPEDGRLRRSL